MPLSLSHLACPGNFQVFYWYQHALYKAHPVKMCSSCSWIWECLKFWPSLSCGKESLSHSSLSPLHKESGIWFGLVVFEPQLSTVVTSDWMAAWNFPTQGVYVLKNMLLQKFKISLDYKTHWELTLSQKKERKKRNRKRQTKSCSLVTTCVRQGHR